METGQEVETELREVVAVGLSDSLGGPQQFGVEGGIQPAEDGESVLTHPLCHFGVDLSRPTFADTALLVRVEY
jgi:hypothetical protein